MTQKLCSAVNLFRKRKRIKPRSDSNLGPEYADYKCEEYAIPEWIEPFMTFLWILLAVDVFVALYWMNYMWVNQKCREAIFKFKDNRDPLNKASFL